MDKQMVRRWRRQYVHDEAIHVCGHPCGACAGRRYGESTPQLRNSAVISRSLFHKIVTEHLLRKLYFGLVPNQLTPERRVKCMESTLIFLQVHQDDSYEFLNWIIIGDE